MCASSANHWDTNGYPIVYPSFETSISSKIKRTSSTLLPRQRSKYYGKMTVVLDMDETLLHSVFLKEIDSLLRSKAKSKSSDVEKEIYTIIEEYKENADFVVDTCGGIAVNLRPGIHTFLRKLSQAYEVVLFTASDKEYAEPILDHIDPERRLLPYRLFREDTVEYKGTKFVKDISLLGRDLKKTVLIDNSVMTMRASPDNCVLIDDFYGDKVDRQLEVMWGVLTELNDLPDVRPCLRETFYISHKIEEILANPDAIQEPTGRNGSYSYKEIEKHDVEQHEQHLVEEANQQKISRAQQIDEALQAGADFYQQLQKTYMHQETASNVNGTGPIFYPELANNSMGRNPNQYWHAIARGATYSSYPQSFPFI